MWHRKVENMSTSLLRQGRNRSNQFVHLVQFDHTLTPTLRKGQSYMDRKIEVLML